MIRFIYAASLCLILFGALPVSSVSGQQSRNNMPTSGPYNSAEAAQKGQEQDVRNSIARGPEGSGSGSHIDYSRYGAINFKMTAILIEEQEKTLRPAKTDLAANAQFLKQPHAGLVRLLPAKAGKVVSVEKLGKEGPPVTFPGGGAFYSFTKLNHVPDVWSDLKFIDGEFEVAFGPEVLGALTMLGDVPLDSLTIENPALSLLAKYAPPSNVKQAKSEYERFKKGVSLENYLFKTAFPVQQNMTYALRSIAYDRSDLLVAFRMLRRETDGSVLILWKRIEKFPTPKLKA
ncbi:MAG TPA: hypothetical protein VGO91_12030 [Pyrinomonadaceae bacterium]|jgi:hypothetical protein|nr:hypothetical protein [Pyrinomonadaceae bacterium]